MRGLMYGLRLLVVALALFFTGAGNLAQNVYAVPVAAQSNNQAKAFFVLDTSNSMIAALEHPEADLAASAVTDTSNELPDVIFTLESGSSNPNSSHNLRPVLVAFNYLFNNVLTSYRGQVTGNLFEGDSLNQATDMALVQHMGCTTSSAYCCDPIGGCSIYDVYGPDHAELYGNSSVRGSSVFHKNNLAESGGSDVTDSNGNEFLYMDYYRNDFVDNYNWSSYWPEFDDDGNLLSYQTKVYTTTGGTVVFNGKEVVLSAGLYREPYLKWIFYVATEEQLASLPGSSRIQLVKNVMESLILNNPTVDFGLVTLNGATINPGVNSGYLINQVFTPEGDTVFGSTGIVAAEIGTDPSTLLTQLDSFGAIGGTPLQFTVNETYRAYNGESANDPNCSGCTYTSPITSECENNFVVLLTDGLPTGETPNFFGGSYIGDEDGDGEDGASSNSGCSSSICANFLDDAAKRAYEYDFSSLDGTQNVISYAVGLGLDFDLLDDFAANGGTDQALRADTADEITEALESVVSMIINTPLSGAGVTLAETRGGNNDLLRPRYNMDTWDGNVDGYDVDEDGELTIKYSVGTILESRDLDESPRTIIAGYDPDHDGNTNQTIAFTTANADTLRPELFELFISGAEDSSRLADPISDFTQDSSATALINFVHGVDQTDMRDRDSDDDGQVEKLGDVVYSQPVIVEQQNGSFNSFSGYTSFLNSQASEPRIFLVGANDGMLHAFDMETGQELWAYIPSSQLKYLERLARLTYNRQYYRAFVDGFIKVLDVYVGGNWRTYAMFGLKEGGSQYVVLDITDRDNPSLVYEVDPLTDAGQSWSRPAVVYSGASSSSNDPGQFSWYMAVGTGEEKTTAGTNLLVYSLSSSLPPSPSVIPISASDPAGTRTSSIVISQNDRDLNIDRLYLGTEEGDVYRVHVSGSPGSWNVQRLYNGTSSQPVTGEPALVLVDNPQYDVAYTTGPQSLALAVGAYFGTGRYDKLSDATTVGGVSQRMIGIFDPVNTVADSYEGVLTNMSASNLQNESVSAFDVSKGSDGVYRIPDAYSSSKAGFYIDLDTSITLTSDSYINPVGMVTHKPVNVRGTLLFSTYLPNEDECSVGGYGFVQAVNFRSAGTSVVDNHIDPTAPFYNGGLHDYDESGQVDGNDLAAGYSSGQVEAVLDVHVESYDADRDPLYEHDGALSVEDVRLHDTNGGTLPSVSYVGAGGQPGPIGIDIAAQTIFVQLSNLGEGDSDSDESDGEEEADPEEESDPEEEEEESDSEDEESEDGKKVTICHIPPGNPANQHTITIAKAALDAHLAHGDYKGSCSDVEPEEDEGETDEEEGGESDGGADGDVEDPDSLPFNSYNLPPSVLSFHEVSGE